MASRQRRVRAIELTLTPQEIVLVWLKNAMEAGTFEEAARHSPPPRGTVANTVYRNVRESMKGQPDPLVERAILQARREADSLYRLVVNVNMAALEGWEERRREYVFLLGYLSAEIHGRAPKNRVEQPLRLVVLVFLRSVIMLEAAIARVAAERLNGEPMLFRDCSVKLEEQVQMAERVAEIFNFLARSVGAAEIDLEQLRKSLQSETDRQVSIWNSLARVETLSAFGSVEEMHAAMDQVFLLCESKSGEGNNGVGA